MKFNTIFLSGMACSFGPFFAVAQQAAKPNVVVIMADDIGYGDLSCYGEKTIHTPNVEKLADGGVMLRMPIQWLPPVHLRVILF